MLKLFTFGLAIFFCNAAYAADKQTVQRMLSAGNYNAAINDLQEMSTAGDPWAMTKLAEFYCRGRSGVIEKDTERARALLKESGATAKLARVLMNNDCGPADMVAVRQYMSEFAGSHDPEKILVYAQYLITDFAIQRNRSSYEEAIFQLSRVEAQMDFDCRAFFRNHVITIDSLNRISPWSANDIRAQREAMAPAARLHLKQAKALLGDNMEGVANPAVVEHLSAAALYKDVEAPILLSSVFVKKGGWDNLQNAKFWIDQGSYAAITDKPFTEYIKLKRDVRAQISALAESNRVREQMASMNDVEKILMGLKAASAIIISSANSKPSVPAGKSDMPDFFQDSLKIRKKVACQQSDPVVDRSSVAAWSNSLWGCGFSPYDK